MDPAVRERIQSVIDTNPVVLFMKGTRGAPQCGFSATVVQILDSLLPDYATVNVLADADIRQGIKEYSDWPTIPQLYVKGEFVGGCDIVKDLFAKGDLEATLGVPAAPVEVPSINLSASAAAAFQEALGGPDGQPSDEFVRLEITPSFEHGLSIGPRAQNDVEVQTTTLKLLLDRGSAKRANGVSIDFVDTPNGKAFKIDNPNEPPKVRSVSVSELKQRLDAGPLHLFDVRTPRERELASIEGARLLDREAQDLILSLPKHTPLYFHCHHGGRSQQAAQFFLQHGYTEVYNVEGGIDAWSRDVDSDVPRYS
jgi:monothiol glutaredoxin